MLATLATPVHADGPVEHEFVAADPAEDLQLSATTTNGSMPAAIETPSGIVRAPDADASPFSSEKAYGGSSTPNSTDAVYRVDRNTTQPDVVSYDDPFRPAVTPFKRLYAFDAVDESLELVVAQKALVPIRTAGDVHPGDDQFYADMVVDLATDVPVRIPSVGPGARVLVAQTTPPVKFDLLRDGADNWFIRARERRRVRLTMQLAIPRSVFGSELADVSWSMLARFVPPLPASLHAPAAKVLDAVGASREMSPRQAVTLLVAYFRAFKPSTELPSSSGAGLYEELSLSQKGVCRHRAYAFVITALALGLPARLVRNEAHAWVEVFDSRIWHRVDLGGAAGRLDTEQPPDEQIHSPPTDPYTWPKGSESGQAMVEHSGVATSATGTAPGAAGAGASEPGAEQAVPAALPPPDAADSRPAASLAVTVEAHDVQRGEPLKVTGRVQADGEACERARVDVALRSQGGSLIPIGSLAADGSGRFAGSVVVPLGRVEVGDYDVVVSTPGDAHCGPGSAQ